MDTRRSVDLDGMYAAAICVVTFLVSTFAYACTGWTHTGTELWVIVLEKAWAKVRVAVILNLPVF